MYYGLASPDRPHFQTGRFRRMARKSVVMVLFYLLGAVHVTYLMYYQLYKIIFTQFISYNNNKQEKCIRF